MNGIGISLNLEGVVQNIKDVEFEGKKSKVIQFLDKQNDKLVLVDLKVDEENFNKVEKAEVGKTLKVGVSVSSFNNKIYYKVI